MLALRTQASVTELLTQFKANLSLFLSLAQLLHICGVFQAKQP